MSKMFYPVLHCIDPYEKGGMGHALANVKVVRENGADGVFLIGHGVRSVDLCEIYAHVRKRHPDFWIGINFLDISINRHPQMMLRAVRQCTDLSALWTDEMPYGNNWKTTDHVPIFAGVAFKYMNPHQSGQSLEDACLRIATVADVATTSGDKTGSPPSLEKLKTIQMNLRGNAPLAVASGVSAENVEPMKAYVDCFLVASSIIERDAKRGHAEYFVPEKVRELEGIIHS